MRRMGPRTDKIPRARYTNVNSTVFCLRAGTNPLGAELRYKISTRGGREREKEGQFVKQTAE